jgi:hypothetical protein
VATTTTPASSSSPRVTGGCGSQPRMKAKPVKNTNCQPNGLKNHSRALHGSAGRPRRPICAPSQTTPMNPATNHRFTRASAMITGIIASTTRYIGRMSK